MLCRFGRTLQLELEELVDRETEGDERCGRADPRHLCAFVGETRPIDGQPSSGIQSLLRPGGHAAQEWQERGQQTDAVSIPEDHMFVAVFVNAMPVGSSLPHQITKSRGLVRARTV